MSLDELERAPFRFIASARVAGDPQAVFAELADPSQWFPLAKRMAWHSAATSGVGAVRDFDVHLFGRFRERMLAWQPGSELAYTMTATSSPLMSRMTEHWQLARENNRTRVTWTVGVEPSALGRPLAPAIRALLRALFVASARGLGKRARTHRRARSQA